VKLIERLYDPTSGSVKVSGYNLKEFELDTYRHQIGYVGQEPVLFNQTIKENMLYGNPLASDNEIFKALRAANLSDFV